VVDAGRIVSVMLKRSPRFSTQVLYLQLGVLVIVWAAGFALMAVLLRNDLIAEYERRGLAIARTVAADERYAAAVVAGDPAHEVQARAELVRRQTGALFVVVTDARGIRFSHPDPALLGKPVSADQRQALDGSDVTVFGPSAAGDSARAKVPLRDPSGAIVGEVIVAIDAAEISSRLLALLRTAAAFLGIALGIGAVGALALTRRLKRQTFGLEPAALRLLLEQQAALRRVATLVARGVSPNEVFDAVTAEGGSVLAAQSTSLLRYGVAGTASVAASWSESGQSAQDPTRSTFGVEGIGAAVARTGRAVRMDAGDGAVERSGFRLVVGAPVLVEGAVWGAMIAGWTGEGAGSGDAEGRITDFTELVATAIANANSRTELAASRSRVVAAADETRRRIERDLHDGTQQRLVSLALQLHAAQTSVPPGLEDLKTQLSQATAGLAGAVEDLQEISRGIHPAVLSKGGLGPALRTLARRSVVPVEIEVSADGRLPERVEVTAYYVVSEALTNVAKHARASMAHVQVDADDSHVRLCIRDDGVGGADFARGSGLIGLRDRVEALSGTIEVVSTPGIGTSVLVTIPIDTG
jgi:signal transduction histidine kinase